MASTRPRISGKRCSIPATHCTRAAEEARQTLTEARRLLARTNQTTHLVGDVVHKTCHTATGLLEQVEQWTGKAQTFLGSHFGNGAGRRHQRKSHH